jgi:hypothetical protein
LPQHCQNWYCYAQPLLLWTCLLFVLNYRLDYVLLRAIIQMDFFALAYCHTKCVV